MCGFTARSSFLHITNLIYGFLFIFGCSNVVIPGKRAVEIVKTGCCLLVYIQFLTTLFDRAPTKYTPFLQRGVKYHRGWVHLRTFVLPEQCTYRVVRLKVVVRLVSKAHCGDTSWPYAALGPDSVHLPGLYWSCSELVWGFFFSSSGIVREVMNFGCCFTFYFLFFISYHSTILLFLFTQQFHYFFCVCLVNEGISKYWFKIPLLQYLYFCEYVFETSK